MKHRQKRVKAPTEPRSIMQIIADLVAKRKEYESRKAGVKA